MTFIFVDKCAKSRGEGLDDAVCLSLIEVISMQEKSKNDPFDDWPILSFEEAEVTDDESEDGEANGDSTAED